MDRPLFVKLTGYGLTALAAATGFLAPVGARSLIWLLAAFWPLLLLYIRQHGHRGWHAGPTLGGAAALTAWAALTLCWTTAPNAALEKLLQVCAVVLPAIAIAPAITTLPGHVVRRIGMAAAVGLALGSVALAAEIVSGYPAYTLINGHPPPYENDHSHLNQGLVMSAVLLWPIVALLTRYGHQGTAWGLAAAIILGIALLDSHSAQLGILCGGLAFALALRRPGTLALLTRAALVLTCILAIPAAQAMYAAGWSTDKSLHRNWRHRVDIWEAAVAHWQEKPLFGWGLEASRALPALPEKTFFSRFAPSRILLHPHNLPLQTAMELGLIGLGLLVILMLSLSRTRPRASSLGHATQWGSIAAGFAIAQAAYGAWQGWWLSGLVFAAMFALAVDARGEDGAGINT